ncbi:MAG TPA: hypothetical protein DDW36_02290 [Candidatus Magasanikbacteria bacterium]|nr:hypothetical protein [Candidatus Magasanikbacteria bacterium]
MKDYLYIFGYETPPQFVDNNKFGCDYEDSSRFLIHAQDKDKAQAWGDILAKSYVEDLFKSAHADPKTAWFKGWIDEDEDGDGVDSNTRRVAYGEYFDIHADIKKWYGGESWFLEK